MQSFSSVGALEAAWYRSTGKQELFSEQHMIDCAWEAGNSGCYGESRSCDAAARFAKLHFVAPLCLPALALLAAVGVDSPTTRFCPPSSPSLRRCPPALPCLPAGGDQIRALNWMFKRGGLALQAAYPYQGVNNFCRKDLQEEHFKGGSVGGGRVGGNRILGARG